jgi:peptide deformylase
MIRKIIDTKDPILRQKSKPVQKVDKKIKDLARDMADTLEIQKDPEGVGLAACQIGKALRMFAMVHNKKIRIIINPEIVSIEKIKPRPKKGSGKGKRKKEHTILEGCLSIPYFYGPLKRSPKLTLKFMDLSGEEITEVFEGFPAQIVQHEVDHLNGRLFIDEILVQKRPLYKIDPKTDEWERVELV